MKITQGYSAQDFSRIVEISDLCYKGVERPPRTTMEQMCSISDIFLAKEMLPQDPDGGNPHEVIIGFAIVQAAGYPYIWSIAVDPAFQGRGVGGNILREIIKKYTLEKQPHISLTVRADNPAQKLYFDYGFRVRLVEKNYYEEMDGLNMRKFL